MSNPTDELLNELTDLIEQLEAKDKAEAQETLKRAQDTLADARRLIADNPNNTDPQKLEADVKRAVYDAMRQELKADEDILSAAAQTLSALGYDTTNTLRDDGGEIGDLIRHSLDAQLLELNIGIYEIERGLKRKAENSFEFVTKYRNKRFNSAHAGRSIIFNYIFHAYLLSEGVPVDKFSNLYNLATIRSKIATPEEAYIYSQYQHLESWIADSRQTALFMRYAVRSSLTHLYDIASGAVAGENLREELGTQADKGNISLWLNTLSVDSLRPTTGNYNAALFLRENIESGLRYLKAYNTLIATVAKELDIPELEIFQLNMETTVDLIAATNEALQILREDISKRETVPDTQALTTAPPLFTQKALTATLEAFRDISPDAPPIPEENIKNTAQRIRESAIKNGDKIWAGLMQRMTANYWRR